MMLWLCGSVLCASAQSPELLRKIFSTPKDSLAYKQHSTLPDFSIRLLDSATIFETKSIPQGRYTAIMLFSPECSHCQKTIEELIANMDSLKNIDFYLISNVHNVSDIMKCADKYSLAKYKNIKVVGQDFDFFFLSYFGTKYVPDIALYDKHKQFIKLIESNVTVKELHDSTH